MSATTTRHRWWSAALVSMVLVLGCGGATEREPDGELGAMSSADRAAVDGMLREFLPALGRAYASGDIEPLRGWAVERVLAQVEKRIYDLQTQGMVIEPELRGLVIEEMGSWGKDFATVTTLETWDLSYYATGSHTLISERPNTKNRVRYQLSKSDGEWQVFYRELLAEFEG